MTTATESLETAKAQSATDEGDLEDFLDHGGGTPFLWLRFVLLFTLLCGLAYPIGTTLAGGALFPYQANGSLIIRGDRVLGSSLVGQGFTGERYFIPRPSAAGAGYDPVGAAGSNYAVSNPALRARAAETSRAVAAREGVKPEDIPVDLIAASGSGLDPHISPEAAALQLSRVARARGLSEGKVAALVEEHTERSPLGLGRPGVNVLELNLSLDAVAP